MTDAVQRLPAYRQPLRERLVAALPALAMTVLLAALVLPPLAILLRTSLYGSEGGSVTLANYAGLFADPRLYTSAINSVTFAVLAMLLSLVNGSVVAWLVERTNVPWKPLATLSAIISLGTPYIVYVSAWLYILGRAGPLNGGYRALFDTTGVLFNVYSMAGMVLIEGMLWSPLVFLLMSATFRRANADLEEAARMSGASVFATVTRISLPLAAPALAGLGLFVFIRNIEAFDVPVLIGSPSKISLLTTDIYLSMTRVPPRMEQASAFSVVLMVVVAVLLQFYARLSKRAEKFASITGKGFRPRPFNLGGWRWLGAALIVINALFVLVLPLLAILYTSLTPFARPLNLVGLMNLTTTHYRAVFSEPSYIRLAVNTVLVAAAASTLAMAVTSLSAWMAARRRPGAGMLEQLASVPLVFPGIVLGVAMIEMALNSPVPIYGTLWVIVFAFVIRYLPYGMRYAHSGVIQIHRDLEDAAGVSGATTRTILRRILLPLASPSLVAGWLFIFLIAAKELSIAVLLAGYDSKTISVAMFDQWTNGAGGEVAAMGVVWTGLMTLFSATLHIVSRRSTDLSAR